MQAEEQCPVNSLSDHQPVDDQQWDEHAHNPFNWPLGKKWMVLLTSLVVSFFAGINATSPTTAANAVSEEFNLDNGDFQYSFFDVTAWNAAAAVVPLATLPIMEGYGMRIGYLV